MLSWISCLSLSSKHQRLWKGDDRSSRLGLISTVSFRCQYKVLTLIFKAINRWASAILKTKLLSINFLNRFASLGRCWSQSPDQATWELGNSISCHRKPATKQVSIWEFRASLSLLNWFKPFPKEGKKKKKKSRKKDKFSAELKREKQCGETQYDSEERKSEKSWFLLYTLWKATSIVCVWVLLCTYTYERSEVLLS